MSNSLELVNFAVGLVKSILYLPNALKKVFKKTFKTQNSKGLIEVMEEMELLFGACENDFQASTSTS